MHDSAKGFDADANSESSESTDNPLVRVFADADGTEWRVFERTFSDYDRRNGTSLIFASESAVLFL